MRQPVAWSNVSMTLIYSVQKMDFDFLFVEM